MGRLSFENRIKRLGKYDGVLMFLHKTHRFVKLGGSVDVGSVLADLQLYFYGQGEKILPAATAVLKQLVQILILHRIHPPRFYCAVSQTKT